jgi:hypothetical protein
MRFRLILLALLVFQRLPDAALADQLLPFNGKIYKDPLGHFTVAVPLEATPCILTEDEWYGGRKTLLLLFGPPGPCLQPWEFRPPTPISTEWYRRFPSYTVISLTATANRRLDRGEDELEWTPGKVALSNCLSGAGNKNRDEERPSAFAGLSGVACIIVGNNWTQWIGTFQRPWINPNEADRDGRGRVLPWVEYTVELYGPNDGFKRHHRTLNQVLKAVTLIPASPDAARNW